MAGVTFLFVGLYVTSPGLAADSHDRERKTLAEALSLADVEASEGVPMQLAWTLTTRVSKNVEGWTTLDAEGRPFHIVIYANSATFRCAAGPQRARHCLLKLASVVRHELWHFLHRATEHEAYEEQLRFLHRMNAPDRVVQRVRASRNVVVHAEQREAHRLGRPMSDPESATSSRPARGSTDEKATF